MKQTEIGSITKIKFAKVAVKYAIIAIHGKIRKLLST